MDINEEIEYRLKIQQAIFHIGERLGIEIIEDTASYATRMDAEMPKVYDDSDSTLLFNYYQKKGSRYKIRNYYVYLWLFSEEIKILPNDIFKEFKPYFVLLSGFLEIPSNTLTNIKHLWIQGEPSVPIDWFPQKYFSSLENLQTLVLQNLNYSSLPLIDNKLLNNSPWESSDSGVIRAKEIRSRYYELNRIILINIDYIPYTYVFPFAIWGVILDNVKDFDPNILLSHRMVSLRNFDFVNSEVFRNLVLNGDMYSLEFHNCIFENLLNFNAFSIEKLIISKCQFNIFDFTSLTKFKKLKALSIKFSESTIGFIGKLESLTTLREIELINNNTIDFSNNFFPIIPNDRYKKAYYQYHQTSLALSNKQKELTSDFFKPLVEIEHLTLYCENCKEIDYTLLKDLTNLTKLELILPSLEVIDPNLFSHSSYIRSIKLSTGNLSNPQSIISINSGGLSLLDLKLEGITKLDKISEESIAIMEIHISGNSIEELSETVFENITNTEALFLTNTKISYLPVGLINSWEELDILDLSENCIDTFEMGFFKDSAIHILILTGNPMKNPPTALKDLNFLETIIKLDLTEIEKKEWEFQLRLILNRSILVINSLQELYLWENEIGWEINSRDKIY